MNGKETPKESLEKYTGHVFLKQLKKEGEKLNDHYWIQQGFNYYYSNY